MITYEYFAVSERESAVNKIRDYIKTGRNIIREIRLMMNIRNLSANINLTTLFRAKAQAVFVCQLPCSDDQGNSDL
jgi:hypothetical protein